ncbi:DUF3871 family protein [Gillisia sp. JM1]|uniref:DUF3871 family protein n=1 Tax=Gillisia sp. JM1 TaxID=1283286 RepID=UPI0004222013|nr:DUF3871 family protein [Gillisia sp. JM1]
MELVTLNNYPIDQADSGSLMLHNSSEIDDGLHPVPQPSQFIKANSLEVSLSHLKHDCIIPVFAKDNEQTISHSEFIELAYSVVEQLFPKEVISAPQIRVSHMIKGRTPDGMGVAVKALQEQHKTIYYERMAFVLSLEGITQMVNGNELKLTIGGVRAYNHENLYGKKSMQKFKFFIGFENLVCCNLCISTDGFKRELKALSGPELLEGMTEVINGFQIDEQLKILESFEEVSMSEKQFAQLMGKVKLYQYLPSIEKKVLPELMLNDNHFSAVAKDYYRDESFCKSNSGDINLWKVYNLLTGANKSSYIDTFLDRGVNAFEFTQGISKAINGDSQYRWFLS